MYKNQLSHYEIYSKNENGELIVETGLSLYEVMIEMGIDKEGYPIKNRDGSPRYFPINDEEVVLLSEDQKFKKINDNFFKKALKIEGEDVYLEKVVNKDNKVMYFVVDQEQLVILPKGTCLRKMSFDRLKVLTETGYAVFDDTDVNNQRLLFVKKFETEDHKTEADNILKSSTYRHKI